MQKETQQVHKTGIENHTKKDTQTIRKAHKNTHTHTHQMQNHTHRKYINQIMNNMQIWHTTRTQNTHTHTTTNPDTRATNS